MQVAEGWPPFGRGPKSVSGVCDDDSFVTWHRNLICTCICLVASAAFAQELEPRAYVITPVKSNAVVFTYAHSSGEASFDPTLPLKDVNATINTLVASYYRSFDLFGRSANFVVSQPYTFADINGIWLGEFTEATRSGLPDARIRFAINLIGGPAMGLEEFVKYKYKRNLGFSLNVVAPTGQYDPAKLVNLGTNRWSFKPQLGYTRGLGEKRRWIVEFYGGAWMFTKNKNFAEGATRTQKPIGSFQFHFVRTFKRRAWASFDATYFTGGRSTVDGTVRLDLQNNSRVGGTFSLPIKNGHGVKFSVSAGAFTTVGADFTVVSVGYQYSFMDR